MINYEEFYNKVYKLVEPYMNGALGIDNKGNFDLYIAISELLEVWKEK